MFQPQLFDLPPDVRKAINVASVPQRSPFRYPGGKTWFVPYIRAWLSSLERRMNHFVEPFAGGGIVSLTVAAENRSDHVIMVELDEDVAAVWETVFTGHADCLARRIGEFQITDSKVNEALSRTPVSTCERAFQTILRNRVNHGGILAAGAGRIKEGEGGRGLQSRWYPETLKKRINEISSLKESITFIQGDGLDIFKQFGHQTTAAFFIDPPYTASAKKAGTRLYRHAQLDHEILFDLASNISGEFLMTYDNDDAVRQLAKRHSFDTEAVAMKNTHHAQLTELLISRNLGWLRH